MKHLVITILVLLIGLKLQAQESSLDIDIDNAIKLSNQIEALRGMEHEQAKHALADRLLARTSTVERWVSKCENMADTIAQRIKAIDGFLKSGKTAFAETSVRNLQFLAAEQNAFRAAIDNISSFAANNRTNGVVHMYNNVRFEKNKVQRKDSKKPLLEAKAKEMRNLSEKLKFGPATLEIVQNENKIALKRKESKTTAFYAIEQRAEKNHDKKYTGDGLQNRRSIELSKQTLDFLSKYNLITHVEGEKNVKLYKVGEEKYFSPLNKVKTLARPTPMLLRALGANGENPIGHLGDGSLSIMGVLQ